MRVFAIVFVVLCMAHLFQPGTCTDGLNSEASGDNTTHVEKEPEAFPDYYKLFGIGRKCSPPEIKRGYRKVSLKWHPDKNPTRRQEADAMMFKINYAYEVLSNPERRSEYDYELENPDMAFKSFGEWDFSGKRRNPNEKVFNKLLNNTKIRHTFNMMFKHETRAGVWLVLIYNELPESGEVAHAYETAVDAMDIMQSMVVNDEYGGRIVADWYHAGPTPAIFLLIDGAPVVYKGNHTNASAIAEFATHHVSFAGQVITSNDEIDFSRNKHRPKFTFYTQKGEVPFLIKLLSIQLQGLVDFCAHTRAIRSDIVTGNLTLPALIAFTNFGRDVRPHRFTGPSNPQDILNFLDQLIPFHGPTIPGEEFPTIESFMKQQDHLRMPKILYISDGYAIEREVRSLSLEFRGKIQFAWCRNTTEREEMLGKHHIGALSVAREGFTAVMFENSEMDRPVEFTPDHIRMLSKLLAWRFPTVEDEAVMEDAVPEEAIDVEKAKNVIERLREQGEHEEADKIEAMISKFEPLEEVEEKDSVENQIKQARALVEVLRAQGSMEKVKQIEELILSLQTSTSEE